MSLRMTEGEVRAYLAALRGDEKWKAEESLAEDNLQLRDRLARYERVVEDAVRLMDNPGDNVAAAAWRARELLRAALQEREEGS